MKIKVLRQMTDVSREWNQLQQKGLITVQAMAKW